MFGIGTGELLLILVIALIVLGPERMPQVARDIGKAMNELRRTSEDLQREFMSSDRRLDAGKILETAATTMAEKPPATSAPAEAPATGETPEPSVMDAGATQADVTSPTPAEPEETAFDREARLARERIDRATQG